MKELSYSEIVEAIKTAPETWLPALLAETVQACERKKVFQDGGLIRLVERAQKKGTHENG